jgi:hypothetical protein
MLENQADMMA